MLTLSVTVFPVTRERKNESIITAISVERGRDGVCQSLVNTNDIARQANSCPGRD